MSLKHSGTEVAEKTLVVGVGSPHGDDQAGWQVIDNLREMGAPAELRKATSPLQVLDWLNGQQQLIVCDAFASIIASSVGDGGVHDTPGSTEGIRDNAAARRWTWPFPDEVVDMAWSGTHDFSLPAALQLAETLGRLPPQVSLWGVAMACGAVPCRPLSESARRGTMDAAKAVAAELLAREPDRA